LEINNPLLRDGLASQMVLEIGNQVGDRARKIHNER
jgi:hypothetical protein